MAPPSALTTLTLNPALDTVTSIDRVSPTHKMRCGATQTHPGGGGVNVARVTQRLGIPTHAVILAGGLTGQRLRDLLREEGVDTIYAPCESETRTALSVRETETGQDYRFTLPMARVTDAEYRGAIQQFQRHAMGQRLAVVSGSLPDGAPPDAYGELAWWAKANGIQLVLDSSGDALAAALQAGVYLFKPSLRELSAWAGEDLRTQAQWRAAARRCIASGQAHAVALTLGEDGADLIFEDRAWRAPALPVEALTTVGAGDSFVGGLVAALVRDASWPQAMRWAMAASAAALLAPGTALCQPADVQRLLAQVQLSESVG
jgi:6-phosphofructokinase 2